MSSVNDPAVVAELTTHHEQYEAALVGNDIEKLTGFFWESPYALRFGVRENLYGATEIEAFRKARSPLGLDREIFNVKIVTFGSDCGVVTLEFRRKPPSRVARGRQSQVWRKFPEGWRIVSAHVSLMYEGYVDQTANLIGLDLPPEYRDAVIENIQRSSRIAAPLFDTLISAETLAAPRFEP